MRCLAAALVLPVLLAGCSQPRGEAISASSMSSTHRGDYRARFGGPLWDVSGSQARAIEAALPALLDREGLERDVAAYQLQYLGITRSGLRLVYVNAYCAEAGREIRAARQAKAERLKRSLDEPLLLEVDDGGDCFFHVFYDPEAGTFLEFHVNGSA